MANGKWDLTFLYNGFDDPALNRDVEKIAQLAKDGRNIAEEEGSEADKVRKIIAMSTELSNLASSTFGYVSLRLSTDCTNADGLRYMDRLSNLMVDVRLTDSAWARFVGSIADLDAFIAANEDIAVYAFILREYQDKAKHSLPAEMEDKMLRMSLDGADAFSKLRDRLMGSHTVELNGQSLPLPAVRGMAYDPDPKVRKDAYEAELKSYAKVETPMAFCLASIKGQASTLCQVKGYDDLLTQTLHESRMDKTILDAMLTAIQEALPDFRRYLKAKGKLLGHENGLPFYDLFAPVGEVQLRYTVDEAHDLLTSTFAKVHPAIGEFIHHAMTNNWIDMFPAEGKEGGAFCAGYHQQKQSRILTNFVGSFSDVSTLAHELGHGWHNRCLEQKPVLLTDTPMPLAETASIFNETLLNQTVRATADDATKFAILENSLMEATQTVVDIYSRFLFESSVVEARKTHIPSAEELKQLMLDAQDKTYGDGLDKEYRHPYMWTCKGHYYSPNLHFYNFPYAFGLLFGLGVYVQFQKEGPSFIPKYDQLLASCGSDTIKNVAATVGIDVTSVDYWRSALSVVRGEIDEFVALCEKK